jgi:hypothetical protein
VKSRGRDPSADTGPGFIDQGGGGMDRSDPAYKGQAGYNPAMVAIYDVWVLRFMRGRC